MKLSWRRGLGGLFAILLAGLSVSAARADLIYVTNAGNGMIGEYTTAGAAVNPALLTGLSSPYGIAVLGSSLFVAEQGSGKVDEYDATTLKLLASVSGLSSPAGVAVLGSSLFVAEQGSGKVDEYDATTLKLLASVSGLSSPAGVAVLGSSLFVVNSGNGTIDEYDATTLKLVKAGRVTGLGGGPYGIAVLGADLFVVNNGSGTIGEYDAATGAAVNPALITGLSSPRFLATAPVVIPEPSTLALLGACLAGLAFRRYRRTG
jgi:hypothetical protein